MCGLSQLNHITNLQSNRSQVNMSSTEDMSKALKGTTPTFSDMPSTIVRATIVQASTVYNDTPKTIGNSPFLLSPRVSCKPTADLLN